VTSSGVHKLLEGASFENSPDGIGVIVSALEPGSRAAYSGLREGDIVVAANRQPVTDLDSFEQALKRSSEGILLRVNRGGGSLFIAIR
jgi:S1-C subfamily serine protease